MLSPYRVLDLTTERGLLCGQILGDLGADVIKIEPPGGSPARHLGPFYGDDPHPDRSLFWWAYNRNKRSMTLDIASEEGRHVLKRLVRSAHFFIESDTPGAMAEYGLDYETLAALNPALVYVSITPFGQSGPKAHDADSDLILMAAGGPLILTGDDDRPPVRVSVPQAYLHASAEAAVAALIAHHERERSGQGQHVDVSAQQAVAQTVFAGLLAAPFNETEYERMSGGAKAGPFRFRLVWPARDGHVAIAYYFGPSVAPFTRRFMEWIYEEGFCDEATRDKDWVRYTMMLFNEEEPIEEYERLKLVVEDFTKTKTKAELLQGALDRGLLIAPVTTVADVANSDQLAARDYWRSLEHQELGQTVRYPGPFIKLSATPIAYRLRPSCVGEHNTAIYCDELGMSPRDLADLQTRGVI